VAARPPPTPRRVPWALIATVAAGYTAGSLFSLWILDAQAAIAVLFPPAGVSVAALLLSPRRHWSWVLATVFTTELVIDSAHHIALAAAVGLALANTVEPLVSALLLRRVLPSRVDLANRRDLTAFLLCAVVAGPLVGAVVAATTIALVQGALWWGAFPLFWAGDAMAVLTVGGAILTRRTAPGPLLKWPGLSALLVVTTVVTVLGFLPDTPPLFYLPVPLLLWVAVRYGVAELASAGLAFTLAANVVTARGQGVWGHLVGSTRGGAASLQLFLAVSILAGWALAIVIRERERAAGEYEREHRAAHDLQRRMLPEVPARLPGVGVDTLYRPADSANEVGGDWYDAFELADGRVGVTVGDIVGHDLRAAVAMGRLHTILRLAAAAEGAGPASALTVLDGACALVPDALCATVGYAEYSPPSGRLRYACAGHPPPMLVSPDGSVRHLMGGRSTPLGVTGLPRDEAVVDAVPGTTLVWYSDGLVERRGEDLDAGLDRLRRAVQTTALQHPPADSWCESILESMTSHLAHEDDIVIICVRFFGATAEHTPELRVEAAAPPH